jgi:hypothetical protein
VFACEGSTDYHPSLVVTPSFDSPDEVYSFLSDSVTFLKPNVSSEEGDRLVENFFKRQVVMLPIVPQALFIEHRKLWTTTRHISYAYSFSLEYAQYALSASILLYDRNYIDELILKASTLLEMEIRAAATTLGSVMACLLLVWLDCGSEKSKFYISKAHALVQEFGLHTDPEDFVSDITIEEAELRRLILWNFFVIDKSNPPLHEEV